MEYLYYGFVALCILLILYLTGVVSCKILKYDCNALSIGLISFFALFYLVSSVFMIVNGSFIILFWLFFCIITIVVACGLMIIKKREAYKKIKGIAGFDKKNWLFIVVLSIIVIQIIMAIVLQHSDEDDSFYVARTSTILYNNEINTIEPSTGIERFTFQSQYAMVGYEVMVAWLCKLFCVNAAVMYHTILNVVLIVVYFSVMFELGKVVSDKKKVWLFLLIIALFNMYSGYSVYSQGAFVLLRIWQGKSVLANIVLPMLLCAFIVIFKDMKLKTSYVVLFTGIILSGFCASSVGVYIIPISYGIFALTYCLYLLMKKKKILGSIVKLIVPVIIVFPFVGIIYSRIHTGNIVEEVTSGIENISYVNILNNINGTRFIFVVFVIATLYFLIYGDIEKKFVFGIYTLLCFVTVLNPFLYKYIALYITGVSVYWRLFWILQISIVITAMVIDISFRINKQIVLVPLIAGILSSCGCNIYTNSFFRVTANAEKIDNNTKEITDYILDNNTEVVSLLLPEEYGYGVRQYTGQIQLIWSRYSYSHYVAENTIEKLSLLYNSLYNDSFFDEKCLNIIRQLDINYIVLYNDTLFDDTVVGNVDKEWNNDDFIICRTHE